MRIGWITELRPKCIIPPKMFNQNSRNVPNFELWWSSEPDSILIQHERLEALWHCVLRICVPWQDHYEGNFSLFAYCNTVLSMIRISVRSAATTSTFLVIRLRQVLLQFCFKIRGEGYWMPKFFQTLYCRIHVFQKRHAFLPLHTPHWPTGCWYQQMVLSNIVDALSFLVTHSKSRHEFTFDTLNNHLPSLWLQCWMAFV